MKKLHLFLLLFCSSNLQAQIISELKVRRKIENVSLAMEHFCDSMVREIRAANQNNKIIMDPSYKKYIDQYFTYLAYNRGTLPIGTSAALELADKETKINLSISKKVEKGNGKVLLMTAGVLAKLDNNTAQLFSGNTPQSGTTFFGNFAFLPGHARYKHAKVRIAEIDPDGNVTRNYLDEIRESRVQNHLTLCDKYCNQFSYQFNCLLDRWLQLRKLDLDKLDCVERLKTIKELESIEKALKDAGLLDQSPARIVSKFKDEYAGQLYNIEAESEGWLSVKFFWFSGGITYTHESYETYDNNNILAKRFGSQDFDAVGFRITANWFKERLADEGLVRACYFNISYAPQRTNTFSILKSQDIYRDIYKNTLSDTSIYFQMNKKAKDITGKKYEENWQHTFSTTHTSMLGKDKNYGINLQAQLMVSPISEPVYSTHAGLLVRLVNNNFDPEDKKSKAKVNFEVFIEFPDMTDVEQSNKTVWQNRIIGINTTVPFNKIFFK